MILAAAAVGFSQQESRESVAQKVNDLNLEVFSLYNSGRYSEAVPLASRALEMAETKLGMDHPETAASLNNLAGLYLAQEEYAKALPLYERALAIRAKVLGRDHPDTATLLNHLGEWYRSQGEYAKALPLYERALAIWERALGPDHSATATLLDNLSELYESQGEYAKALPLYERVLAIREKSLGKDHPDTAAYLNKLGELYRSQGEYAKALPLYEQALAIRERSLGKDHPDTATLLDNLALLYQAQGEYAKALQFAQRALTIYEKSLGMNHPDTAKSLNNLAELYRSQGQYLKALSMHEQALAIRKKVLGEDHPDTADSLNNLALLYKSQGEYVKALPLYERALAIYEKTLGKDHPYTARSLANLAGLRDSQGEYAQSLPLYERALSIREKALGPDHPDTNSADWNFQLAIGNSNPQKSLLCQRLPALLTTRLRRLERSSLDSWEAQTRMSIERSGLDLAASARCSLELTDPSLPFRLLVASKGRLTEEFRLLLTSLRSRAEPEFRLSLDQYLRAARQSARLTGSLVKTPSAELRAEFEASAKEEERLRQELAFRSKEFRNATDLVTEASLREILRGEQVLVEIVRHAELLIPARDGNQFGPARYGAFVLTAESLKWTDLGAAAPLESIWERLMFALPNPDNEERAHTLGRDLANLLIDPILPLVKGKSEILIALDGPLRMLPIASLIDGYTRPLIEENQRQFHLIGSGRDLLRFADPLASRSDDVIVVNPDYGDAQPENKFGQLLGAAAEGEALKELLHKPHIITGPAATRAAIENLRGPRILHMATHAYYRKEVNRDLLLNSGIALANANLGPEGILTAKEVVALDLRGTQLAALSACETALGESNFADGLVGLQRALTLAGTRTQFLSLWPVDDTKTRDLMVLFYTNLVKKDMTKSEALRQAQLTMMRAGEPAAYWASFVLFGDPGKLGN